MFLAVWSFDDDIAVPVGAINVLFRDFVHIIIVCKRQAAIGINLFIITPDIAAVSCFIRLPIAHMIHQLIVFLLHQFRIGAHFSGQIIDCSAVFAIQSKFTQGRT